MFNLSETTILTILVSAYFLFVLWYGLRGTHQTHEGKDFLTANQNVGWLFCALSLVSTIIGGSATLGMGTLAQKTGTAAFWWLGVGAIGLIIHGWLIVPKIRRMKAVTLPEVLLEIAGPLAERYSAIIIATSWVAITAAQFVALYALLVSLAGDVTGQVLYWITVAGVLLHTIIGGQRGVIRTDVIQAVMLLVGFSAAAVWLFVAQPERVAAVEWQFFTEKFGFLDWASLMLLVGITYVIGPDMFSRSFAAKDATAARKAAWAAAPVLVLFAFVITLLAVTNLGAKQPVGDWLGTASLLPFVLKAMLSLGLISALCGSADTVMLSAAGIFERDILKSNSARNIQIMVAIIGIAASLMVYVQGNIIKLLLTGYALFVPGVAIPLLVSLLLSRRALNHQLWVGGAVVGGICGVAANLTGMNCLTYMGMVASATMVFLAWCFSENKTFTEEMP